MMHYALVARLRVWNTELLHPHLHNNYKTAFCLSAPPSPIQLYPRPSPLRAGEGEGKVKIWR